MWLAVKRVGDSLLLSSYFLYALGGGPCESFKFQELPGPCKFWLLICFTSLLSLRILHPPTDEGILSMVGPFLSPLCSVQDPKMPYTQQLTKTSLGSAILTSSMGELWIQVKDFISISKVESNLRRQLTSTSGLHTPLCKCLHVPPP